MPLFFCYHYCCCYYYYCCCCCCTRFYALQFEHAVFPAKCCSYPSADMQFQEIPQMTEARI